MSSSFTNIKQSHVFFDDSPGLKNYYEDWASRYDVDLADQKWVAPRIAANLVHLLASAYVTPDTTVFDAGCGTAVDLINGKMHDFGGGSHLPPFSAAFWKMER